MTKLVSTIPSATADQLMDGDDVAYFSIISLFTISQNDRIEIWITNVTDGTGVTVKADSEFIIESV